MHDTGVHGVLLMHKHNTQNPWGCLKHKHDTEGFIEVFREQQRAGSSTGAALQQSTPPPPLLPPLLLLRIGVRWCSMPEVMADRQPQIKLLTKVQVLQHETLCIQHPAVVPPPPLHTPRLVLWT
jgi:hypothetical protein